MRLGAVAVALVLATVMAGCGSDGRRPAAPAATGPTSAGPPSWLVTIFADAGTSSAGRLILSPVDPNAVTFTDRPRRLVRRVSVEDLVANWAASGFVDDPPNATLLSSAAAGSEVLSAVELTQPVLEGKTLSFSYKELDEVPDGSIEIPGPARVQRPPRRFTEASLFLDSADDPNCTVSSSAYFVEIYIPGSADVTCATAETVVRSFREYFPPCDPDVEGDPQDPRTIDGVVWLCDPESAYASAFYSGGKVTYIFNRDLDNFFWAVYEMP